MQVMYRIVYLWYILYLSLILPPTSYLTTINIGVVRKYQEIDIWYHIYKVLINSTFKNLSSL